MDISLILLIAAFIGAVLVLGAIIVLYGSPFGSSTVRPRSSTSKLRNLIQNQRSGQGSKAKNIAVEAAKEGGFSEKKNQTMQKMTLERKLKFAHWTISPLQFRIIQILITLVLLIVTHKMTIFIKILVLALGPKLVTNFLDKSIQKRFDAFDKDYPVLLLSYVGLLKTGMNTIVALEAAAQGLDKDSLVRAEVSLMAERLRLGLTEEQAIGSFGEDIAHPEIELFVQSLLLSRKVGGTLSTTLERLARQVRKRQQFRQQAVAAVGMERSSIYIIALVMGCLLTYLIIKAPELILPALSHSTGNSIFQAGVALVIFGFWWSKVVTKIKV